ncbi:hypothetical protein RF11_04983 [Thelohanellus kitauei]|uniref:Uncharacterized protein n=1 Tax=Thelohanellus kitauei TaxID=669202 RepID=A0A0C2I9Y8_THEKT|nr:hypothetical protein RF11_04983 [Thelohanellus kitauei]
MYFHITFCILASFGDGRNSRKVYFLLSHLVNKVGVKGSRVDGILLYSLSLAACSRTYWFYGTQCSPFENVFVYFIGQALLKIEYEVSTRMFFNEWIISLP